MSLGKRKPRMGMKRDFRKKEPRIKHPLPPAPQKAKEVVVVVVCSVTPNAESINALKRGAQDYTDSSGFVPPMTRDWDRIHARG